MVAALKVEVESAVAGERHLFVAAERMQGAAKVVVNLRPKYARRADTWVR